MIPATAGTKRVFVGIMQTALAGRLPFNGIRLAIAWAAFETNWGRTTGWLKGNNAYNISASRAWLAAKKPTVAGPDTEYDDKGNVKDITQAWRAYGSVSESVQDMLDFISDVRFGNARIKLQAGDTSFSDDLYHGKYFTLPPDAYRNGVASLLSEVNNYS